MSPTTTPMQEPETAVHPILAVRPLGFLWETQDPFLFCAHHLDHYPPAGIPFGPDPKLLRGRNIGQDFEIKDGWRMYHGENIPGFPGHPHRGFETITVVQKGLVDHADSFGSAGRYGNGDVQWMTAGKGIQHSEMFPLLHSDKENTLELFQIWLNLPSQNKMVDPDFLMLWNEDIPVVTTEDSNSKKTTVKLISGSLEETKSLQPTTHSWAKDPENEVSIWIIEMEEGAEWTFPKASPGLSRNLYFFEGDFLQVAGSRIQSYQRVVLRSDANITIKNGTKPARTLILQGRPIAEPIAQYGPFVMNTQSEIQKAFFDFQATRFGGWPWDSHEPVHPIEKGRFAKYLDGRLEDRSNR